MGEDLAFEVLQLLWVGLLDGKSVHTLHDIKLGESIQLLVFVLGHVLLLVEVVQGYALFDRGYVAVGFLQVVCD